MKTVRLTASERRANDRRLRARWKKQNQGKNLAHCAVRYAIQTGRLKRGPCETCGKPDTEAHHDDYLRRLDVRWLCRWHHRAWHKEHGEALNASAPPPPRPPKSSRYVGVYAFYGKWRAKIGSGGNKLYLGSFRSEEDAARAYDAKARELRGAAAKLNFPNSEAA